MLTRTVVLAVLLIATGACRDGGRGSGAASSGSGTTNGSSADGGTPTPTTTTSHDQVNDGTTGKADPPQASPVSFVELRASSAELIGDRVEVEGTVHFSAVCPPAGEGQGAPCVLTGYLAAPGAPKLTASDLGNAIALAEDGQRLSCSEADAADGGCPGWKDGHRYRMVATVARQNGEIQLEVVSKTTI